jgi:hypothetical protein
MMHLEQGLEAVPAAGSPTCQFLDQFVDPVPLALLEQPVSDAGVQVLESLVSSPDSGELLLAPLRWELADQIQVPPADGLVVGVIGHA